MTISNKLDELVDHVSLYTSMRLLFHGYVLPFILLYAGWVYAWICLYDFWEFYEAGMIGLAAIGCLQILLCLCCHWSVHIQCFLTCRKVIYQIYFV